MQNKKYTIKTMSRKEIDIAVDWAAKEGWNPGLYDADCYYSADPNGFLIGLLDDEPIATISVVKYSDSFGFLGFYIVKPEYRGQGYGIRIWRAALEYLEGLNIGLDGVVSQQENYKKSGFKPAYRNIRYEGVTGGNLHQSAEIVQLSKLPFDIIDSYDRPFFPSKRSQFIRSWINQPDSHALGIMQNGKLAGYGVIRPCRSGYKIAPLFAENSQLADSLFLAFTTRVKQSEPVFLDIPETNQAALILADRHNMKVSFETVRMYTGVVPHMPLNRIFGVASFEIG